MINTRFPPEPNGYLHLGHLKAMIIDFEKHPNCNCILRFDDTNPETEKQEYVDAIIEDVRFFGYQPSKITYASDYFNEMLELAWILVKSGKAYVDFSSSSEIEKQRGKIIAEDGTVSWIEPQESKYRNHPIEQNISDFKNMIDGKYSEGQCSLRLKMNMKSNNPNMRDLVAYRIKYTPHYRTGTTFCVYPSYDFCHCIIDALEKIDHSYCTLEFVTRQESYFWLIDQLNLHKPVVYEFSRLNFENTLLSKRKIKALIQQGKLLGYDDPRLLTIKGLKKRGYTASALKDCVREMGHTRNISTLKLAVLEHSIRNELNHSTTRIFGFIDPLKCTITNYDEIDNRVFDRPIHPEKSERGTRKTKLEKVFYIDSTDFRMTANRKYYRLTSKQKVRLKYADGLIEYVSSEKDSDGNTVVYVKYTKDTTTRVKGCIGWVSNHKLMTFNMFTNRLFNEDGSFNEGSYTTEKGMIENLDLSVGDRFQIERFGYVIVNSEDSLNFIVSLREARDKNVC